MINLGRKDGKTVLEKGEGYYFEMLKESDPFKTSFKNAVNPE